MTKNFWRVGLIAFGLGLATFFGSSLPVAGQTPQPALTNLMVELWPEYDRPEVLVIYQVELSPTTPLPVEVTFPLPGHIERMFVVAVEQSGGLFEAPPDTYFLSEEGDQTLFTLFTPERRFQFEYYDPEVLSRQAETRTLDFEFTAPYAISRAMFQVQEPVNTSGFTVTPAAESSFIGQDGLNYSRIQRVDLAPGDTVTLSATYQRSTEALTAESRAASGPPNNAAASVAEPSPATTAGDNNQTLGYLLIGVGSLLFLAAGGSWWWTRRQRTAAASRRRRQPAAPSQPKRSHRPKQPHRQPQPTATFCYKCGTALREGAHFCHNCGAERR